MADPVITPLILGSLFKGLGGIFGSKARKKAQQKQLAIAEQNRQDALRRFEDVKGSAVSDQARGEEENDILNDIFLGQSGEYDQDIEGLRTEGRGIYDSILKQVMSQFGPEGGDTSASGVLAARARGRDRLEQDAVEASTLRSLIQRQLTQEGPSASQIASLLRTRGGSAISRSFEDSGNKAAMELSRTGGDTGSTFARLARERADALRDNDVEAELGGLTGSEQIASSRMGRLSPLLAQLSARATAQPSGDEEVSVEGNRNAQRYRRASAVGDLGQFAMAPLALKKMIPTQLERGPRLNFSFAGSPLTQNTTQIDPRATSAGGWSSLLGNLGSLIARKTNEN